MLLPTLVERQAHLDARPESARRSRRLVAAVLRDAGRLDLLDAAQLLVSELVTNAVVHARTQIELFVSAGPGGLRVAVRDRSAHLPTLRRYDRGATTGRGLQLVRLLAHRHGANSDGHGKTVWFELGAGPGMGAAEAVPAADSQPAARSDPAAAPTQVRLLGVPVRLLLAWRQQADTLLREHLLVAWEESADHGEVPDARAQDAFALLADALGPLEGTRDTPRAEVSFAVSAADAAAFASLTSVLDDVIARAERGQLLAPPTQPETRVLRRWICAEVSRQAAGAPPRPWPGLPAELDVPDLPPPDWDPGPVRRSTEAVLGADDLNRILAASPAALALLGWDEDLVGRRIVEVVPPRLREAHIAGFTTHLVTGASAILDTEVQVPALRRDGTEVDVVLLIRRESAADGRPVFTATMRELRPKP